MTSIEIEKAIAANPIPADQSGDAVDVWAALGLDRPGARRVIDADVFLELFRQSAEQTFAAAWEFLMDQGRTVEDLRAACSRVGRNNEPALIWDLWCADGWYEEISQVVGDVWSMTEYPERALDQSMWLDMFDFAGFRRNGQVTTPPAEPLTLYRGATTDGRCGMSWTDDLTTAETFARGALRGRATGTVWTAVVEPRYLLANIDGEGTRGESEYVIDTTGLKSLRELGAPSPKSESQCHICDDRARVWSAPAHRSILNIDDVDVELDLIGWCAYCAWHKDEE